MRILAFAAEPWEIRAMMQVLDSHERFRNADVRALAISDNYTFQYEPHFLSQVATSASFTVFTLEDRFLTWQAGGRPPNPPMDVVTWLQDQDSELSEPSLKMSDIILAPFEYRHFLRPMSEEWSDYVLADILDWCQEVITEVSPDLVLTIDRRRVASLGASVIAKKRGIPMLSMIQTRVGHRWMVRTDLGIGMSDYERIRLSTIDVTSDAQRQAESIVQAVKAGQPLYEAAIYQENDRFKTFSKVGPGQEWRKLRHLIRGIAARHVRGGKRSQVHKRIRRYGPSYFRTSWMEVKIFLRSFAHVSGITSPWNWDFTGEVSRRYVLWPLHVRPENASSALNNGVDEIEFIHALREALSPEIDLVVKENSLMIGHRGKGFYRELVGRGILLANPVSSTATLVHHSVGVAGASGTVLLEASIRGKPTLALGSPEFLPTIAYGPYDLTVFVRDLDQGGPFREPEIPPTKYLAWIIQNSRAYDVPFLWDTKSQAAQVMFREFGDRFWMAYKQIQEQP